LTGGAGTDWMQASQTLAGMTGTVGDDDMQRRCSRCSSSSSDGGENGFGDWVRDWGTPAPNEG